MFRLSLIFFLLFSTVAKADDLVEFYFGGSTGIGFGDNHDGGVSGVNGGLNINLSNNWFIGVNSSVFLSGQRDEVIQYTPITLVVPTDDGNGVITNENVDVSTIFETRSEIASGFTVRTPHWISSQ